MHLKDGIYIEKEAEYAIILEKYHTMQIAFDLLENNSLVTNLQKQLNPFWGQDIIYFDYKNVSFLILSSTGAPSAANAVERAKKTGVKKIICIGTCGSTNVSIEPGTFILSIAAVRDEGATLGYLDIRIPAIADLDLTLSLKSQLIRLNQNPLVGTTYTTDKRHKEDQDELCKLFYLANVINIDMETSAYLLISKYYNISTAVVNIVTDCAVTKTDSSFKGVFNSDLDYCAFISKHLSIALKGSLNTFCNE